MTTRKIDRNSRASTMTNGRQYATGVEGAVISFECEREGHKYKINYGLKSMPISRRMGPAGCALMAGWWSREKGGCIGTCPTCKKQTTVTK
jgi:hypothetical protein